MQLFLTILLFLVGLVLIVKGGDWFVDAATWMAEVFRIPKFIIGATIVSLATTLPEVFVSSIAAAEGHSLLLAGETALASGRVDIAISNAIGSVTANTGMILAIGILFMPNTVRRKDFAFKGILLMSAIVLLGVLSWSGALSVWKSILLLAVFALFIWDNLRTARNSLVEAPENNDGPRRDRKTVGKNLVLFVLGTAGIVIGSQLLVDNGTSLARAAGISEKVIGLTAIAIGTSLPELVTTITAIVKKQSALSVGNVIGANVIDTVLILPICSMIYGGSLPVAPQVLHIDLPVCLLIAAIAIIPTIVKQKLSRWQGVVSLILYFAYIGVVCFAL